MKAMSRKQQAVAHPSVPISPKTQQHPSLEEAKEKAKEIAKTLIERKFKEPASLEDIKCVCINLPAFWCA